jgi:hypothetical protein
VTITVDLAHHSGRYDNMRVREGFDAVSPHASVIAHTEFANNTRASILKTAATKAAWGFFQNNVKPYDECCFTWDTKVWRHLDDASWSTRATAPGGSSSPCTRPRTWRSGTAGDRPRTGSAATTTGSPTWAGG